MKRTLRYSVLALAVMLGAPVVALADNYVSGLKAFRRGDLPAAVEIWRPLAEKGHAKAQAYLGWIYLEGGEGVPQDLAEALKWSRLSADQGDGEGQHVLGLMYREGQGVQRDPLEAMRWFRLAAEQGYFVSQGVLGLMYATGEGMPQDKVQALMWMNLALVGRSKARENVGASNATVEFADTLAKSMTPDEVAEAQRLADEWTAAHPSAADINSPY